MADSVQKKQQQQTNGSVVICSEVLHSGQTADLDWPEWRASGDKTLNVFSLIKQTPSLWSYQYYGWKMFFFFSYTVPANSSLQDGNLSRRVLLSLLFLFQFPVLLLPLLLCLALIVHTWSQSNHGHDLRLGSSGSRCQNASLPTSFSVPPAVHWLRFFVFPGDFFSFSSFIFNILK